MNAVHQPYVDRVFTIELDKKLASNAQKRFAYTKKVHVIQGDSKIVLQELLKDINEPCLFWLDAHYSGGKTACGDKSTPIEKEFEIIFGHKNVQQHLLLIDDARCFNGENDYPRLEDVEKSIENKFDDWILKVENDIIITYRQQTLRPKTIKCLK